MSEDSYFQALICHLFRQPAFQIKPYSLSQHLVSQSVGLSCDKQTKSEPGNKFDELATASPTACG